MVIKGGAVMNMVAFGKKVVKFRIPILIISILLLIPAGLGYVNTRIPSGDGSSGIPCIKAERRTHFRNSTWTDDESCNIARTRQSCV